MRKCEVDHGSYGNDAGGIDGAMTLVVVPLDVPQVDRVRDPGHLIELAQVTRQVRIVGDAAPVALEVAHLVGVKTQQRREQPPVRLRQTMSC